MDYRYLYVMFPNKENRVKFLTNSILYFGLRLETIANILNTSEEFIYSLIRENSDLVLHVKKTFTYSLKDQNIASENFINYYNNLVDAHKKVKENRRGYVELLDTIFDTKVESIIKDNNPDKHYTDEDILAILKYQLKYMFSSRMIESVVRINRKVYADRVRRLNDKYPELVKEFEDLSYTLNALYKKRGR